MTLDEQGSNLSLHTWQQRERKVCAFKTVKEGEPDNSTLKETTSEEQHKKFRAAMKREINLRKRKTLNLPRGAKVIATAWAFKIRIVDLRKRKTFKPSKGSQGNNLSSEIQREPDFRTVPVANVLRLCTQYR